jgi:hypothetical protein
MPLDMLLWDVSLYYKYNLCIIIIVILSCNLGLKIEVKLVLLLSMTDDIFKKIWYKCLIYCLYILMAKIIAIKIKIVWVNFWEMIKKQLSSQK